MIRNALINVIQALKVGAVAHRPCYFSCRFDQGLGLGKKGGGRGGECEVQNLTGAPIYRGLTGSRLRSSSWVALADGIPSTKGTEDMGIISANNMNY
ncbi:MAG: hypothetical protein A2139_04010 [Desulfobacca sp. RBG_16_60_12]|nr:MAG: hypothetical protein A2139_04010 [Desulfobacca sp. RBG_16_60_12]